MNMSLIIMEDNYVAIDSENYTCNGYYIIKFSSCLYTLQADLSIDGQVISSGEIICEGNYFFQSISVLVIMSYKKINLITQLFL